MLTGVNTMLIRLVLARAVSATPPSIVIVADSAWGSGVCARCVEQQQQHSRLVLPVYCFNLEGEAAPPPLEPPPTHGLCNSRLCVGHASVHSDSGSRAWGPEVVRVVFHSSSTVSAGTLAVSLEGRGTRGRRRPPPS